MKSMIIDEHRHIGYCGSNGTRTVEDILAEMDRLHVDKAVLAPSGMKEQGAMSQAEDDARQRQQMRIVGNGLEPGRATSEILAVRRERVDHGAVLEAVRKHPDRLRGCWSVNPGRAEEDLAEAGRAVREEGFVYLKLHPILHAFAANDEVVFPVMECARELGVPVWFHSSYGPGSEIVRIAEVARRFPATDVILGHAGVRYLGVDHAADAVAAARDLDNVWIDLSDCWEAPMRRIIAEAPAERLFFASDDPFGVLERQMQFIRGILQGDAARMQEILGENAARLLKIGH